MGRELDLDVMLAEEERLPSTMLCQGRNMGHLDNNSSHEHLQPETRIEIPLWLARELKMNDCVAIEFPKHYGTRMRHEMSAGAEAVNLRSYSFYFFEVALLLIEMGVGSTKDTRNDLRDRLRSAFLGERYHNLTMRALAQGKEADDIPEFRGTLTSSEAYLFSKGHQASRSRHNWRSLMSSILTEASVLGRKSSSTYQKSTRGGDKGKRPRIN